MLYPDHLCVDSRWITFVSAGEGDPDDWILPPELKRQNILWGFVDGQVIREVGDGRLLDVVSTALHLPQWLGKSDGTFSDWMRFIDPMIMIPKDPNIKGLSLLIGNADYLFKNYLRQVCDLMQAFLISVEDWIKYDKPCHLYFELSGDEISTLYSSGTQMLERPLPSDKLE